MTDGIVRRSKNDPRIRPDGVTKRESSGTVRPVVEFPLSANVLAVGGGYTPTVARTTTAAFTDYEGVVRMAAANELRFEGGRRVENLCPNSEATSGWNAAGTTPPTVGYESHLGINSVKIDFPSGSNTGFEGCRADGDTATVRWSVAAGRLYAANALIHFSRVLTGTEEITFYVTGTYGFTLFKINAASSVQYAESFKQAISIRYTPSVNAGFDYPVVYVEKALSAPLTVWVTKCQCEDITRSSYQLPSEYVPTTGAAKSKWFTTKPDGSPIFPAPKLLMEGQSQNLNTYSADFNSAYKSEITVTVNATTAPDGSMTADLSVPTAALRMHYHALTGFTPVESTLHTLSVYAKPAGYNWVLLRSTRKDGSIAYAYFNVLTGVLGDTDRIAASTITAYPNGWYRCSITFDTLTGASDVIPLIAVTANTAVQTFTGDSVSGLYLWGRQLEASPVPTSYIPTTTEAVPRTADACSWPLSSELQAMLAAEGTIALDWTPGFIPPASQIGIMSCAAAVDSLLSVAAGGSVTRATDGVTPITGGATLVTNTQRKLILRWSAASGKYQLSSIASGVITHGTEGNFDGAFTLGSNLLLHYSNAYPAKYSALKLFKRYLTDSELMRLQ